jgi:chromosome segregation ATPase
MSESSQFQNLLWQVSNGLAAAVERMKDDRERIETLAREHGEMRERLARLEEAKVYTGEERREMKDRLGTGDHTFERIKHQAADAERLASQAFNEIMALKTELAEKTKIRAKRRWFFIETSFKALLPHFIKAAIVIALWLIYHFAVIARIGVAAKPHGGGP